MGHFADATNLPNVNSSVARPEAERAATKAVGPGIGMTGMFSLTHNLAWPLHVQTGENLYNCRTTKKLYQDFTAHATKVLEQCQKP